MKKLIQRLLHFLFVLMLLFSQANLSVLAAPANANTSMTFEELGSPEIILRGPYDVGNLRFNLPPHWVLQDGVQIQLLVSSFLAGEGDQVVSNDRYLGALLEVYFNGRLQQSIPLKAGSDILYTIPVNASDLESSKKDGSLEISFFLDASIDCDYYFRHTTVLISSKSQVLFNYEEAPIKLDLGRLPWPLYQPAKEQSTSASVVVFPNSSADEMQAALLTMAAFGRMTNGQLPMSLLTADQLSDDVLNTSDLIFVGTAQNLQTLSSLKLPLPFSNSGFLDSAVQADDGVLELVPSPWSATKSILVVSGNSGTGVVKAAQALSTANVQTDVGSDYSIVAEVKPISSIGTLSEDADSSSASDFTLADLGYGLETVIGVGTQWFSYEIILPPGQIPKERPYIDLVFSNSALVDPARSGFVVYWNAELIGSARFTEESTNSTTAHITIPFDVLRPGRNQIDVAANLIPLDACALPSFNGMWMSIFPESVFHLPLVDAVDAGKMVGDIKAFPYPFINDPSLSSTLFVLPKSDARAWAIAGKLAYEMGKRATGAVLTFETAYNGLDTEAVSQQFDLLLIGLPTELPLISEMKSVMPGYFEQDSNVAILKDQQVVYRISDDKSLGYLELFDSPWNEQLSILAILGTTPEGLEIAGNALTDPELRAQLQGNFVTIDGEQVLAIDTRSGRGTGRLLSNLNSSLTIEQTMESLGTESNITVPPVDNKRFILFALVGVVVMMLIVIMVVSWRRLRNPERSP